MLPEVDRILAIGWAANEQHFLRLVKASLTSAPDMAAVSGTENFSRLTMENLMSSGFAYGQTQLFPMGFSQFVEERAGKPFLSQ
jgi:hypothetical protein